MRELKTREDWKRGKQMSWARRSCFLSKEVDLAQCRFAEIAADQLRGVCSPVDHAAPFLPATCGDVHSVSMLTMCGKS